MILIVEDHEDTRLALTCFLGAEGYQVFDAGDGVEALRFMQGNIPELVVLDSNLPGITGEAVLVSMRNCSWLKRVPVIFYSADPDIKKRARNLGAQDFIWKGLGWEVLLDSVKKLTSESFH